MVKAKISPEIEEIPSLNSIEEDGTYQPLPVSESARPGGSRSPKEILKMKVRRIRLNLPRPPSHFPSHSLAVAPAFPLTDNKNVYKIGRGQTDTCYSTAY